MTDAVRLGFVGLGGIARRHAGNAVAAGHDVAGADVAAGPRETFADEFDAPTFDDHAALLEAGVDAVVVTTPNSVHAPPAVAALDRDVPVLVEKPLADDLAAAERIADAARESAAFCAVGFQHRFAPAVELFDVARRDGRLGDVRGVTAEYVRRRGIPSLGSWFTDRERAGGGALVDIGVHALDAALFCLGFPEVLEVSGTTRALFGGREDYADPEGWTRMRGETGSTEFDVEDGATAFVRCAGGRTLVLEAAWAADRPPGSSVRVQGTAAGATFDLLADGGPLVLRDAAAGVGARDHYRDQTLDAAGSIDRRAALIERFCGAVADASGDVTAETDQATRGDANVTATGRDRRGRLATVEEGLTVQRVLDAVYRSAEAGRAVEPR